MDELDVLQEMNQAARLILLLSLTSCAPRKESIAAVDPIGGIWKAWAEEIATLDAPGTPKSMWDSKTTDHYIEAIKDIEKLRSILDRYESLSEADYNRYVELFETSPTTYDYGFEGDFSALVFFDEGDKTIDAFLRSS